MASASLRSGALKAYFSNRRRLLGPQVRLNNLLIGGKSSHAATGALGLDSVKLDDPVKIVDSSSVDTLDLSFRNAEAAFKSKTTWEVLRAYIVFTLCSSSYLVENNMKIMKFCKSIFGKSLFELFMKGTFYGHFVAGENQVAIQPTLKRLRSFGVKSILDYSVEEDMTSEEAAQKEMESSVSAAGDDKGDGAFKRYHAHEEFADRRYKVQSARTYFYLGEAQCEKNMDVFLRCVEAVSDSTHGTGFTAIKLTALGRPQLLLQLSEVIARTRRYASQISCKPGPVIEQHLGHEQIAQKLEDAHLLTKPKVKKWYDQMTFDDEGLINIFPWSGVIESDMPLSEMFQVPDLKTGQMRPLMSKLTADEEEMFRNMLRRMHSIFKRAKELDVRVMVDAEQSYFQPAITRLTMEMMKKYNKEKAIIFNTYQCYCKEAYHNVVLDLEESQRMKFYFGAKLVRGAYMEQERDRAKSLGYEDPINPTYEATTAMYEKTLMAFLYQIKQLKEEGLPKRIAVMVASHNEDTVRFTIHKMKDLGIYRQDKVVCFGQLFGMCDQVSFPLGQGGFSVYKYVPYGPVGEVLPYLSRRANENRGILTKIKKEKSLLREELFRRLKSGQLMYKPHGHYKPA